jgi:class 3 adenylate cyclase/FixJ family two-component response regulator
MSGNPTKVSKGKILIVEHEPVILAEISTALSDAGYRVQYSDDGRSALSIARTSAPDLILLETHLPGMNGYEVCQHLKARAITWEIPIIFIGHTSEPFDKPKVFAVGAADYVVHPFSLEELIVRLEHQLKIRELQRQLFYQQTRRLLQAKGTPPVLADLQKRLHQQARALKEQNSLLQQEVYERQQVEAALRAEQEKSDRLLLNILPSPIADQLKQQHGLLAERFENATILFADLVDFTPLAARIAPLELVTLLNQIFSAFDRLAEKYGLEKIKTIGDAYMVVGGVPVPREDHAQSVMEMAIAMLKEIKQIRYDAPKPLQIRIGMNSGAVVAGVIGIKKFSYDLWGDAVNIASRMESQGLPGKIQVTESTYHLLKDAYHFEKWDNVNVKGRGKITTYLFVGRRT